MKKLLATLIAGFLVSSAFAQAPAAPAGTPKGTSTAAATPAGEATVGDKSTGVAKPKHKHVKKTAAPMAK